jgi:hypothetical protein
VAAAASGWAAEMDEWMDCASMVRRRDKGVAAVGFLGSGEKEELALSRVTMESCNIAREWASTAGVALCSTSSQLLYYVNQMTRVW